MSHKSNDAIPMQLEDDVPDFPRCGQSSFRRAELNKAKTMMSHKRKDMVSGQSVHEKRYSKLLAGREKEVSRGSFQKSNNNNYDVLQKQRYGHTQPYLHLQDEDTEEDDHEDDQENDQENDQEDEDDQEEEQEVDAIQPEEETENVGSTSFGTSSNTRKESRALDGAKKKSVNKGKLVFQVDECAGCLIGEDSQYLITKGGCVMREHAKFDGTTWKNQPFLLKKDIITKCTENSTFDPKSKTIDSQLGNQHRSRQYLFHLHYKKYPTQEAAINHPPVGIKSSHWVLLCEKFASKKFQELSARNKNNRAANEIPPTVGTRSVARRVDIKRREGKEVTFIDQFKMAHWSEDKKEMVNDKAKKIWSNLQNDATASSSTPAEICFKWLKRIPGHLKGGSAPKKQILANESLREQVEHERKRAEASEKRVEELTELCTTLQKDNEDTGRKMGFVLDQLAHFTGVQFPQES